jgi:hypothetical protein
MQPKSGKVKPLHTTQQEAKSQKKKKRNPTKHAITRTAPKVYILNGKGGTDEHEP